MMQELPVDPDSDAEDFARAYDTEARTIGRANIAVFGMTGVGKSSLVNAIFGKDVAMTGMGEPVTRGVHKYVNASGTLAVWDCEGFELNSSPGLRTKSPRKWLRDHVRDSRGGESDDRLDVAWFVVSASSRRLEKGQRDLIDELNALKVPVVLVLSQVPVRHGVVAPNAQEFASTLEGMNLPMVSGAPVLTAAVADTFAGTEIYGLEQLLEVTLEAVPEGRRAAFAAAQKIDLKLKTRVARAWTTAAASVAGGIGAVPIPFADAAVLVPTQLVLMAKIARLYEIPKGEAAALTSAATSGATILGKFLASSALKLIPGVGLAISAGVAASLTAALGEAWRVVCEGVFLGKFELDSASDVLKGAEAFKSAFTQNVNRKAAEAESGTA